MPTLATYDLPAFAAEAAEQDIMNALVGATDLDGQPLFVSVDRGWDAEIADVTGGSMPDDMPLARFNVWAETEELDAISAPVYAHQTASVYCFFFFGNPATDAERVNYVTLRRRFLASVLTALQLKLDTLTTGIDYMRTKYWKRDVGRPVVIDYASPYRYLTCDTGVQVGYNCVRIDYPLLINAGATL